MHGVSLYQVSGYDWALHMLNPCRHNRDSWVGFEWDGGIETLFREVLQKEFWYDFRKGPR